MCHLGFGCVAAPALTGVTGFVLTLGPFCPAEEPRALEPDARRGLAELGVAPQNGFPVPLDAFPSSSRTSISDLLKQDLNRDRIEALHSFVYSSAKQAKGV